VTTLIYSHGACGRHDTGPGHPESAARLSAVLEALKGPDFKNLRWREAPRASMEQLTRLHPLDYVERVLGAVPDHGYTALDGDTVLSPGSGEAALRAAGAACAAVDAVLGGEARTAFCAIRPPGHHAEPAISMGFCMFNNVAVAAFHALEAHGLQRVAVIDFDVHHGNGTQAAFWDRAACQYLSTHQSPLYPGTGRRSEQGAGNIVNTPLRPGSGSAEIRYAWSKELEPALRAFAPELIFISAGFDAHYMDPLAGLSFTEDDYRWLTRKILAVAGEHAHGRVVSMLEGGYNLEALGSCVAVHVQELQNAA